ncbi:MAG TPA: hypothetical protein VMB91_08730 [Solirubrobacteraceae bacterium]|nr:hypothetical protein [Solirubrobacteraceae bacterium]
MALVACGALASSAFALTWWVEAEPPMGHELLPAERLSLGPSSSINSPFTLKWKKKFEISCSGSVAYKNLFLEGHLGIGTEGIEFAKCVAKKPKGTTLIGEKVETEALEGTVTQSGAQYPFTLSPQVGSTVVAFQLERTVKPRKHYKAAKNKLCKYSVEAIGKLAGTLGEKPEKISTKKTLNFANSELTMKSTKECEFVMSPAQRSAAKPLGSKGTELKTAAGPLASGSPVEASSSNLVFSSSAGNIECNESTLSGTLTTNDATTDVINFESAELEGNPTVFPDECPSASGPLVVEPVGLPWIAGISSKGAGLLKGRDGVTIENEEGLACTYEAPKSALSFANTTSGPEILSFQGQVVALGKSASPEEREHCAPQGAVSGTFQLESGGEVVEAGPIVSEKERQAEAEEVKEEEAEEAEEEAGLPLEGNKGKVGYEGGVGWGVL